MAGRSFTVWFFEDQARQIERRAKANGMTVSDYLHSIVIPQLDSVVTDGETGAADMDDNIPF